MYSLLEKTLKITKIELYSCNEEYFFRQDSVSYYWQFVGNTYLRGDDDARRKPYRTVTDKAEIEALTKALRPYYLTVGQDVSYVVVTYEGANPKTFIIKN